MMSRQLKHIAPVDHLQHMKEKSTIRQCAACNQEVSQDEALYSGEVDDIAAYFCSPTCKTEYRRTAAPSKQEVEERSN
jgi:YHS domain-containing protein